jgi:hypothetical protein
MAQSPAKIIIHYLADTIRNNLTPKTNEWVETVMHFNKDEHNSGYRNISLDTDWHVLHVDASDNVSQWLDGSDVRKPGSINVEVETAAIAGYFCSSCGNSSATLKACAGCGKAKYCDPYW